VGTGERGDVGRGTHPSCGGSLPQKHAVGWV
jgi:hypothetical protein